MKQNKNIFLVISFLVCEVLFSCASSSPRFISDGGKEDIDGLPIENVIEQSAAEIMVKLPVKARVAIAAFDTEHQNLSNYIMDELAGALTGGNFEVTDRRNLGIVYKELSFQMTGEVSDETAASIGKFLGAQYVITGQFLKTGSHYRYRVSCINVETAVQESSVRLDVRNDHNLQSLISDLRSAKVVTPTAYSRPAALPGTAGAFLDRGTLFAIRGDWELAIADFTEAIKLDEKLAAAWVFRGRAFAASVSFMLEIENDFSDFIAIVPDVKNITTEQKAGYNKAIADYTQAIKLDPNFAPTYRDRGVAYSYSGAYDKAIADFNQSLKINPNDPATYRERGNVYGLKGDEAQRLADYNRAISVNPNFATVYVNRGNVYSRQGDEDRAIADYNYAIRLNPNELLAYYNRGGSYLDKKEYDRAIADYTQAIWLNPNYYSAYYNRGITYLNKGNNQYLSWNDRDNAYDRAIADFTQAIRINANSDNAYVSRGIVYFNKDPDFNRAIADFQVALKINPNNMYAKGLIEDARDFQRGR